MADIIAIVFWAALGIGVALLACLLEVISIRIQRYIKKSPRRVSARGESGFHQMTMTSNKIEHLQDTTKKEVCQDVQ